MVAFQLDIVEILFHGPHMIACCALGDVRQPLQHRVVDPRIADLNGSLFPFGWAKLLWRLKVSGVRTARVPLMGVRDEYQVSRIGPVIALLLIEALRDPFDRRKIDALEM